MQCLAEYTAKLSMTFVQYRKYKDGGAFLAFEFASYD